MRRQHRNCSERQAIPEAFLETARKFDPSQIDLYVGGVFLGCEFGVAALYVWAVGLLAAGQSSTMTGTYAGQYAMEGFLNLRWKQWQRLLVTRSISILPALIATFFEGIENLTEMNDMNVLMSVQLPFASIPLLTFTNSREIMGPFVSSATSKVISMLISLLVIGVNSFFGVIFFRERLPKHWAAYAGVAIIFIAYLAFITYLALVAIYRDPHCRRKDPMMSNNIPMENYTNDTDGVENTVYALNVEVPYEQMSAIQTAGDENILIATARIEEEEWFE